MSDIRVMQWNVGGFYTRDMRTPAAAMDSYDMEDVGYFVDAIAEHNPDIITMQETHASDDRSPVHDIGSELGYNVALTDYSISHINPRYRLGQAILTREAQFDVGDQALVNPGYHVEDHPDFGDVENHDKRISWVSIRVGGQALKIVTFHAIPHRIFGIKERDHPDVIAQGVDVASKMPGDDFIIVGADFNIDSSRALQDFPGLVEQGFDEVPLDEYTSPTQATYDHVVYKGNMNVVQQFADPNTLADHHPVIWDASL